MTLLKNIEEKIADKIGEENLNIIKREVSDITNGELVNPAKIWRMRKSYVP